MFEFSSNVQAYFIIAKIVGFLIFKTILYKSSVNWMFASNQNTLFLCHAFQKTRIPFCLLFDVAAGFCRTG